MCGDKNEKVKTRQPVTGYKFATESLRDWMAARPSAIQVAKSPTPKRHPGNGIAFDGSLSRHLKLSFLLSFDDLQREL